MLLLDIEPVDIQVLSVVVAIYDDESKIVAVIVEQVERIVIIEVSNHQNGGKNKNPIRVFLAWIWICAFMLCSVFLSMQNTEPTYKCSDRGVDRIQSKKVWNISYGNGLSLQFSFYVEKT